MNKTSQRILAIGLPLTLVAATGIGFAYWTSAGSTTDDAATDAAATVLTVAQVSAPTDMAPGVAAGDITVTVTNPGPSSVQVSQVVASIDSVASAATTCAAGDYTLANATMTDGATELASGASATFTGATLGFNNLAENQDDCKGATVTLKYDAS